MAAYESRGCRKDLTRRECEVVSLLCEGLNNSEIAERLSISVDTLLQHLSSAMCKLCVSTRLKLVIHL
jgi:DNA-binding NarL/FixJ family response regulator